MGNDGKLKAFKFLPSFVHCTMSRFRWRREINDIDI